MRKIHLALLLLGSHQFSFQSQATDFLWGVANSAFQVEGNPAPSDWRKFTQESPQFSNNNGPKVVSNFYEDYADDFRLARQLNANSFRISIAWERIQPTQDSWDEKALDHYAKMIRKMKSIGLTPVVTLHHFVLPQWLAKEGGLLHPNFPDLFSNYAKKVFEKLSQGPQKVEHWISFNEPNVLVYFGYVEGIWPPLKKDSFNEANQALAQIVRAHLKSVTAFRKISPKGRISIAKHWRVFEASNSWNPLDQVATKLVDWIWNQQILSSIASGKIFLWMPGAELIKEELPQSGQKQLDYLGVNYYGRLKVSASLEAPFVKQSEGPGEKTDLGWEIYPEGLYKSVVAAHQSTGLDILVSENGLADAKDHKRPLFLKEHLEQLMRAKQKIPLMGYLHWSLTDNFEWAEGLHPRFGLVEIKYGNQPKKVPRESFHVYKDLIENFSKNL